MINSRSMAGPAPVQPPQAAQLLWHDGQRADHGPGVDYGNSSEHWSSELKVVSRPCPQRGLVSAAATGVSLQPQAWARWTACGRLAGKNLDFVPCDHLISSDLCYVGVFSTNLPVATSYSLQQTYYLFSIIEAAIMRTKLWTKIARSKANCLNKTYVHRHVTDCNCLH